MSNVSVAVVQMSAEYGKPDANRHRSTVAAQWAFASGADVVVLPELCVPGYGKDFSDVADFADDLSGETIQAWHRIVEPYNGVIIGGIAERSGSDIYNSAVAVGRDGVLGVYRKLHLFANERSGFTEGNNGLVTVDTSVGRIGLCICYDLRFVEVLRGLSLLQANLVCAPSAWVLGYDTPEVWNGSLFIPQVENVRVQANLNQLFVACSCLVDGTGEEAQRFLGNSVIVGPDGGVILGPMPRSLQGLGIARISLQEAKVMSHPDELVQPRTDRRDDVYGLVVDGRVL